LAEELLGKHCGALDNPPGMLALDAFCGNLSEELNLRGRIVTSL
jgi:hypothetical protein